MAESIYYAGTQWHKSGTTQKNSLPGLATLGNRPNDLPSTARQAMNFLAFLLFIPSILAAQVVLSHNDTQTMVGWMDPRINGGRLLDASTEYYQSRLFTDAVSSSPQGNSENR